MEKLNWKALLQDESFLNFCRETDKQDIEEWEHWLRENPQFRDEVEDQKRLIQSLAQKSAECTVEENYLRLKDQIEKSNIQKKPESRFKLSPFIKLAASFALVAAIAYLLLRPKSEIEDRFATANVNTSSPDPAKNALLTLADGSTIPLADVKTGTLILEGGTRLEKTANGDIVYHAAADADHLAGAYNSISTAKGGQYKVTLPDGSVAILNASSSLRYPLAFSTDMRRVEMTGEVYFEITKSQLNKGDVVKSIPFMVVTDRQEIRVLGTRFNVNAYKDEPMIVTTLVEGSIRVTNSSSGTSVLLKPGEQALLADDLRIAKADLEQQTAWTTGDFIFRGEELESILRKVSRWYNVEIDCPVKLGKIRFDGIVSRNQPLSAIIDMIQTTGKVNIELLERRIVVKD